MKRLHPHDGRGVMQEVGKSVVSMLYTVEDRKRERENRRQKTTSERAASRVESRVDESLREGCRKLFWCPA